MTLRRNRKSYKYQTNTTIIFCLAISRFLKMQLSNEDIIEKRHSAESLGSSLMHPSQLCGLMIVVNHDYPRIQVNMKHTIPDTIVTALLHHLPILVVILIMRLIPLSRSSQSISGQSQKEVAERQYYEGSGIFRGARNQYEECILSILVGLLRLICIICQYQGQTTFMHSYLMHIARCQKEINCLLMRLKPVCAIMAAQTLDQRRQTHSASRMTSNQNIFNNSMVTQFSFNKNISICFVGQLL